MSKVSNQFIRIDYVLSSCQQQTPLIPYYHAIHVCCHGFFVSIHHQSNTVRLFANNETTKLHVMDYIFGTATRYGDHGAMSTHNWVETPCAQIVMPLKYWILFSKFSFVSTCSDTVEWSSILRPIKIDPWWSDIYLWLSLIFLSLPIVAITLLEIV